MERSDRHKIVEALILAAPTPISAARLADIVPRCTPGQIRELIAELNADYEATDRAFEIWEVAGGYQLRTRAAYSHYLQQLHDMRPVRLSNAALETLALITYRQPVTRAEIERVRGVDVGATLRSLIERKLVKIAGHKEAPGRPMLYATTRRFLEVFGFDSLKDLPTLRDLEELTPRDSLSSEESEPHAEAEHALNRDVARLREIAADPAIESDEFESNEGEASDGQDALEAASESEPADESRFPAPADERPLNKSLN